MFSPLEVSKWAARQRCHGRWWLCCQYVDEPMCNSNHDPHIIGRIANFFFNKKVERMFDGS